MFLITRRHGFGNRVGVGGTLIIPPSDSLGEFVFCFSSTLVFYQNRYPAMRMLLPGDMFLDI